MPRAQYRNRHVTEAASLRIGGVHTRDHVRPSIGARCGKAARRDLCGGTGVTRFPTASGTEAARLIGYRTIIRCVRGAASLAEEQFNLLEESATSRLML